MAAASAASATAAMASNGATRRGRHTLVWVYGTLKKGFHNHSATGMAAATFIGRARTVDHYPLLTLSPYHVPFLLDAPGVGCRVDGEVYDVDDVLLERLDELEGHPSWYHRREIAVEMMCMGNVCAATNDSSIANSHPKSHGAPDAALADESANTARTVQAYLLPQEMFKPSLVELPEKSFLPSYTLEDHQRCV